MARPSEYTPAIVEEIEAYLEQCEDEENEFHKTRGDKSDSYERLIKVKLPTIEGLALHLGISKETLYQWEKELDKPEFTDVLGKLRVKQADRLINNGLSGDYSPVIAKLLLMKHGYKDESKQELTGKDGQALQIIVPQAVADSFNIKTEENK